MGTKKYRLTGNHINIGNRILYQIEALKDFGDVKAGDLGGYIESEENLSQYDNAWVFDNARVYGNACVFGDAQIKSARDYIVFKNWWSSGRYFTWTRSNNMWKVGCFYGTGEELIKKAYNDSKESGREYERVVRYVEEILEENYGNKED